MAGFFDCTAIRCADECTGSVQRAGDKDDRNLGKQWVGATFSNFFCACLSGWQLEETLLQHLWKSSRAICCWEV